MEGTLRRGRHQAEQSTVLLKNVVPVEGTASCVFVKRKRNGLTASAATVPLVTSSGVACFAYRDYREILCTCFFVKFFLVSLLQTLINSYIYIIIPLRRNIAVMEYCYYF